MLLPIKLRLILEVWRYVGKDKVIVEILHKKGGAITWSHFPQYQPFLSGICREYEAI